MDNNVHIHGSIETSYVSLPKEVRDAYVSERERQLALAERS